jgi:membrane-associated phospholipid phosphatase
MSKLNVSPAKFSTTLLLISCVIFNQPSLLAQEKCQQAYTITNYNRVLRKCIAPSILLAGSAATWDYRKNFRSLRNQYLPRFRYSYDDYLQYAPAVLVFSLQAAGVRGKHNMKRTVVAYVFSSLLVAGLTNTLKYTTRVERPDGSARNSYPSGHTANAFMNASLLHHEYGDRSWMYSAGGYTAAIATAMGRQLNNRHWVSDIMTGAAIGIISSEVGNYLAEKLLKPDGTSNGQVPVTGAKSRVSLSFRIGKGMNGGNPEIFFAKPGMEIAIGVLF